MNSGGAPASSRLDRYAGWVANAAAVGAAVTTLYFLWLTLAGGYVDAPWLDQMAYLTPQAILQLWKHHNGHLIVFPRLIFWIDDAVFGGRNQFNIAVILLIQAAQAALLVLLARALGFRSRRATAFVVCMAIVLVFATCQHESFVWGWEVEYCLVDPAFTAGAYALLRYNASGRRLWLASAIAAGLVSAGSLANGLAALPVLALLALAYGRRRAALALLLAAVFAVAVYWAGREANAGAVSQGGIVSLAAYGLLFLSNPIAQTLLGPIPEFHGPLPRPVVIAALWIGAAVAAATTLAVLSVVGRLRVRDGRALPAQSKDSGLEAWNASLALLSVIVFAGLTMAMTTMGRSGYGVQQALSGRYATPVIPLLVSVLLLLGHAWRVYGGSDRLKTLVVLALGVALAAFAWVGGMEMRDVASFRNSREGLVMALAVGIEDDTLLPVRFYDPAMMMKGFARLRRVHKSLFSEPWVQAVGRPLGQTAILGIGGHCESGAAPVAVNYFAAAKKVTRFQPSGGVWAPHDQHPTPTILMTDARGVVVGVGRVRVNVADVKGGGIRANHKLVAWRGELAPGTRSPVTAYLLVDRGRRACPIGVITVGAGPGA
jgi:hypothetical protein